MRQLDTRSRDIPKIAEAVHQLTRSRDGEVTLTPGATITVVIDPTVTPDTVILFDPLTANAAAEIYAGTMYVLPANRFLGSFAITHLNAGTTDRAFRWLAWGQHHGNNPINPSVALPGAAEACSAAACGEAEDTGWQPSPMAATAVATEHAKPHGGG
jgi:hypothetical protein